MISAVVISHDTHQFHIWLYCYKTTDGEFPKHKEINKPSKKSLCARELSQDLVQGAKIMAVKILPRILSEILDKILAYWQDLGLLLGKILAILPKNFLLGKHKQLKYSS